MSYRENDKDPEELAKHFRDIAAANISYKTEADKLRASRFVPKLLPKILRKIKRASKSGNLWTHYTPPIWLVQCWFAWDRPLRLLLKDELEKKGFRCTADDSESLMISWYGDQDEN